MNRVAVPYGPPRGGVSIRFKQADEELLDMGCAVDGERDLLNIRDPRKEV